MSSLRYQLIVLLFFISSVVSATWFENIPRTIKQPDGSFLHCLITGDQYYRRLHDQADYTIIHNSEDGYFYYALKDSDGSLIPSTMIAGRDNPRFGNLEPGYSISKEEYKIKKIKYHQDEDHRDDRDAPSSGSISQINVFIRFADDQEWPFNRDHYASVFDAGEDEPSLKHYFNKISYDSLFVDTYHYPGTFGNENISYDDEFNRAYYEPYSDDNPDGYQSQSIRFQREHALLANALNSIQVSSSIDVDVDGNGFVDAVSFVVYGSTGAWADLLWPHKSSLFGQDVYINDAKVYDYLFMLSESWYFNVGVLCHEFGHVLGAPDYYHYDGGNAPTPIGHWDIMASTNNPPQFPSAFTKWKYFNWIEPIEINTSGNYSLSPLQEKENSIYKIASPYSESEYFVLEYRKLEGMYDSNAPGNRSGLVVYRVNSDAGNGNASGPPDELYVYRPGGTLNNTGNFSEAVYNSEYGHTELNDDTDPSSFLYNDGAGGSGGLDLFNVSEANDSITFSVLIGVPELSVSSTQFEYILEPGEFEVQTLSIVNSGEAGSVLSFDIEFLDGDSSEIAPWLLLSSDDGSLEGDLEQNETGSIYLQVYATDITEGDYIAFIEVTAPGLSSIIVEVNLTVDGSSIIPTLPEIDIDVSDNGIVNLPADVDPLFSAVASRYTHIVAPNNDLIPILIQDDFSINQIEHVKRVLHSYLVDLPNSDWGMSKAPIANAIGATNAILFLLNDESEYDNPNLINLIESGVNGQDLLSTEVFPEGSYSYMNSEYRDATFEEVLHFVHGYGIQLALPSMQEEIESAMEIAISGGYYAPLFDLPTEDYDEEYLAMGLECYFGLWAHDPSENGFCGDNEYGFIDRISMSNGDPFLFNIVQDFFGDMLSYSAVLPSEFSGEFHLSFQPGLDYTYRSQYFKDISLRGSSNVALFGNDYPNNATGNDGSNTFNGFGGDDIFIGLSGHDIAIYRGNRDQYIVYLSDVNDDSSFQIVDTQLNRDGTDYLSGVEQVEFNGINFDLSELLQFYATGSTPHDYVLKMPYPNPFNPKTKIAFDIPKDSKIELVIYDINGRLVRKLKHSIVKSGQYEIEWDATDGDGNGVSTGIYFVSLLSEKYVKTQKIILLR